MNTPWVNWFWKPKKQKDFGLNYSIDDLLHSNAEFMKTLAEFHSRLSHFESTLDDNQLKIYWGVKEAGQRVTMLRDRFDFISEIRNKLND